MEPCRKRIGRTWIRCKKLDADGHPSDSAVGFQRQALNQVKRRAVRWERVVLGVANPVVGVPALPQDDRNQWAFLQGEKPMDSDVVSVGNFGEHATERHNVHAIVKLHADSAWLLDHSVHGGPKRGGGDGHDLDALSGRNRSSWVQERRQHKHGQVHDPNALIRIGSAFPQCFVGKQKRLQNRFLEFPFVAFSPFDAQRLPAVVEKPSQCVHFKPRSHLRTRITTRHFQDQSASEALGNDVLVCEAPGGETAINAGSDRRQAHGVRGYNSSGRGQEVWAFEIALAMMPRRLTDANLTPLA